jgi:hypothetical protein
VLWYLTLVGLLFLLPPVTAQETRNFNTCYAELAASYQLVNMFSKYTIDLLDPQFKQFVSSLCNYYHEKTGQWFSFKAPDINQPVIDEFLKNHMDLVPEQLRPSIEEGLRERGSLNN